MATVGTLSSVSFLRNATLANGSKSNKWIQRASKFYPDHADGDYRVKKVSAKKLDRILFKKERELPMVIDFYATWCGPCIMTARILEQLAVEYQDYVSFLKVDTDEEYEFARDMGLRGLPTMVFVNKEMDKHALRTEGIIPIEMCREIIEKQLLDKPMPLDVTVDVLGWKKTEVTY